jgi:RNA polymerase sigma factor (sigma-70 family)
MAEQLSDAILLERFVSRREEAAFVALVERHGPLVQRICRRVLRNEHDIEDVFQATFLVLARRAAGISWCESVGGWLGAVAHRLALGARADLSRQNRRETPMTTMAGRRPGYGLWGPEAGLLEELHPCADPVAEVEQRELGRLVKDELLRLPEKYRSPVVLCYFEGRTHEEAARQLGYPAGSMSRRLKRAQALLRRRLIQRGFSFATGLLLLGFAVVSGWSICHRSGDAAASLRSAMSSLEPQAVGVTGLEALIARIDRPAALQDCERILAFSRRATQVAEEIEDHEPGKLPDQWRKYSTEMRHSAVLLAQATQQYDQPSMLTAARRLNATCVGCHEAFRESSNQPAPWSPRNARPIIPATGSENTRSAG